MIAASRTTSKVHQPEHCATSRPSTIKQHNHHHFNRRLVRFMPQEMKKVIVYKMIDDINHDIIQLYEEMMQLHTNIDIDMTCYIDDETNTLVCK